MRSPKKNPWHNKKNSGAPVNALLFDLGGVVIDIDFNRVFTHWAHAAAVPAAVLKSRFSFDAAYEAHETGQISGREYFDTLRKTLGIELTDEQFTDGWNQVFVGEMPGVNGLLQQAKQLLPLYAFTNSNNIHQEVWEKKFAGILSHFTKVFNSSGIGARKPETEAFRIVADAMGVDVGDILFFDDGIENVEGARRAGLMAVYVKSTTDVARSLDTLLSAKD